jgi:molybdenum cofactor biosynthesis protein B
MPGIDESRPFIPVSIAVLTISDSRTPETDGSGDLLVERLQSAGHRLAGRAICADEIALIQKQLNQWIDAGSL